MSRLSSLIFPTLHQNLSFSKIYHPTSTSPHMSTPAATLRRRNKKLIVITGPTGCGKSKLSIDLTSRFFPQSEIINSDKIQVYRGLDITTNKIPIPDRKNVRHHLIDEVDSSEFTTADFRSSAATIISQIISRRRIPFIVGGSNSFVHALLVKKFNPDDDVFSESSSGVNSVPICKELRYNCCFIWVDVSLPVLNQYLEKRVDDMLNSGMFEELADYFQNPESNVGMKKAIGVPEFEKYFSINGDDEDKRWLYDEAVRGIKDNTCQLAKRQLGKILRLRDGLGWDLKRVDATAAIRAAMEGGGGGGGRRVAEIWEREVVETSVKIVKEFLDG